MALMRSLVLTIVLCFVVAFPALAEGQRVILVIDASGSMWGQIDGKAKMDIAKEVVGKVVGAWKPEDELGLVAYGHRKKGACDDIETLIEPGALNPEFYMEKVKALTPKGKTPMTQSVRQAAEALKYTEKQATVILVSDGIETCDPNPCAVAAELEKLGVGLTVHTVGFGLDDKGAVAQLKCLAENTGGISILAENADELEMALNQTVQAPTPEPEPAPPQPEPAPTFNLKGRIVMSEGVDQLPAGFASPTWEIFRSINGEKGDWVKTEYGPEIKTNIEQPGDYLASVSLDVAKLQVPVKIEAGKMAELDLSFEAGMIAFKAMKDATTALDDPSTTWELLSSNGEWLATKYGPEAAFFAGAGAYKIRLSLGDAKVEQDVAFQPGKIENKPVVLGAAIIAVTSFFTSGGDPLLSGATIELKSGEAGLDGKHKWIATQYGPSVMFKTAAGKYRIFATQDYAVGFADVEAKAGETTAVNIAINAGVLGVAAPSDATIEIYTAEKDLAGMRKWIATSYNGVFNAGLNAGSYFVSAKKPDGSVYGEREITVEAGKRVELTLP